MSKNDNIETAADTTAPAAIDAAEQSADRGDAKIAELGVEGIQALISGPTTVTEIPVAAARELTLDEAIRALISALGVDEEYIRGIEIRPHGSLRLIGNDNSARAVKFASLKRYERNADGSIKQ